MIPLLLYQSMTPAQRKEIVKGPKTPVNPVDFEIQTCYPHYVAALFLNRTFPNYPKMEGGTAIILSEEDIYNGELRYQGIVDSVTMIWKGYITQLYEGKLKLCPISDSSVIEGLCNDSRFEFRRSVLWYGVWPGFIELYK